MNGFTFLNPKCLNKALSTLTLFKISFQPEWTPPIRLTYWVVWVDPEWPLENSFQLIHQQGLSLKSNLFKQCSTCIDDRRLVLALIGVVSIVKLMTRRERCMCFFMWDSGPNSNFRNWPSTNTWGKWPSALLIHRWAPMMDLEACL